MKIYIALILLCFSATSFGVFHYEDYADLRDNFEVEKDSINKKIDIANNRYITSLSSYQSCSSDRWRVTFTSVVPEIDKRRLALGEHKRKALLSSGKLNSEWLKTAREHSIGKVKVTIDISDFYYWYKGHIELSKQGPLHELEIYVVAIDKLSSVYEKMSSACNGNPAAAKSYDLVASGIRGLLDEVFSLIGQIV